MCYAEYSVLCVFQCSYVPVAFCEYIIVPLVKCKTDEFTDVNNSEAISFLENLGMPVLDYTKMSMTINSVQ